MEKNKDMPNDKQLINVIVPIYHGKQYIAGIISQLQECQQTLCGSGFSIELVLMNDAPDELLDEQNSDMLSIHTYNTKENRGIHGARVYGLSKCHGEYVLFLDQDDFIKPSYFISQLHRIGEHDAVVCRLINDKKNCYNNDFNFEKVMTKEYMLDTGCPIISPGQVLMRRSAIPEVWKENIVKNNGADDFFLWLCMIKKENAFALNDDILFEHVVNHENASGNSIAMRASEREIVEIIKKNHLYGQDDVKRLEGMLEKTLEIRLKMLDRFHSMFYLLDTWMELKERKLEIPRFLENIGCHSVAIYGMNQLARRLVAELKESPVTVEYIIDRNSDFLDEKIQMYSLNRNLPNVDMVIIALVQNVEMVKKQIYEATAFSVMSIAELLAKMENLREESERW